MWRFLATIPSWSAVCLGVGLLLNGADKPALKQPAENAAKSKQKWMSHKKRAQLVDRLPRVDDRRVERILRDPKLLLYTEQEMPRAYQQWDGGLEGLHAASYNISANRDEPHGNGNLEFPWGAPAGTHRTSHVESFRFLRLPSRKDGKPHPVVWEQKRMKGDSKDGYAWRFPIGTAFGEVLGIRAPSGKVYTFEFRLRRRETQTWAVDVFRPYLTARQLSRRIRQLRPQWQKQPKLKRLIERLEGDGPLRPDKLVNRHPKVVFEQAMGVDPLPGIDDDVLVAELLTKVRFQSALGSLWRVDGEGRATSAPTTKSRFHIVPRNYDAGFVEVDRDSCARCHETVGRRVTEFEFYRDWYGRIRGSDGIFSFHPFALDSISYTGIKRKIKMRPALLAAGMLEKYDARKHDAPFYSVIPSLEN